MARMNWGKANKLKNGAFDYRQEGERKDMADRWLEREENYRREEKPHVTG